MNRFRIRDICEILNGFAFKSENYVDHGYRIIRIANVQKGYIEDNAPVYYPTDSISINKYVLKEGDLLMSLTGNVGRVALLRKEFLPAVLNQRVACLRLTSNSVSKRYLFNFLNSDFFEKQCIAASNGVAQKNMSTEWLKDYLIPLPDISHQNVIVSHLESISSVIDCYKKELNKLDLLIKARFVEMFGIKDNPIVKLGSVCSRITDGTHKTPIYLDEGVKFISAKNIINGELDLSNIKYISNHDYEEIQNRCQTEVADILLTKSGSLGMPAIVKTKEPLGLFESLAVIKYDRNKLLPEYLCEQLKSDSVQRQFARETKGVAVKHLHLGVISNIEVSVPPISRQKEFSSFVNQVDKSKVVVQKGSVLERT